MRALLIQLVLVFGLLTLTQSTYAQCPRWKKDHHFWELRTAVGLTPTFVKDHSQTSIPPVSLEIRYRPNPTFSIGLLAGTSASTVVQEHFTGSTQEFENEFRMVALRAGVHTRRWEKWETYGGIVLAYQNNKVSSTLTNTTGSDEPLIHYTPRKSGFFYSAFLGTAYKPIPQLKLFGELSYGLSIATVGVGFSL
ncbi:MAG: hypothetical protein AAFN81_25110 [Bacteroidota bacterium]